MSQLRFDNFQEFKVWWDIHSTFSERMEWVKRHFDPLDLESGVVQAEMIAQATISDLHEKVVNQLMS